MIGTISQYARVVASIGCVAATVVIEIVDCFMEEIHMERNGFHDPSPTAEGVQWLLIGIAVLLMMSLGGS